MEKSTGAVKFNKVRIPWKKMIWWTYFTNEKQMNRKTRKGRMKEERSKGNEREGEGKRVN